MVLRNEAEKDANEEKTAVVFAEPKSQRGCVPERRNSNTCIDEVGGEALTLFWQRRKRSGWWWTWAWRQLRGAVGWHRDVRVVEVVLMI